MTRRFVLCLGPHRSGISMVAAALDALGAAFTVGGNDAGAGTRQGFLEHPEIVAFNEALLARLGTSWDSPVFDGAAALAAAGLDRGALDEWIDDGAALVTRLGAGAPLAAARDPRLCLLLPVWLRLLQRAGYRADAIRIVHVTRDAAQAAKSRQLCRRADPDDHAIGENLAKGAALWMSYSAQALDGAGAVPALMIDHAAILNAPAHSLDRLAAFLDVAPAPARRTRFAADFIDAALCRSRRDDHERAAVAAALPGLAAFRARLQSMAQAARIDPSDAAAAVGLFRDPDCRKGLDRIARGIVDRRAPRQRDSRADLHTALEAAESARDALAAQLADLQAGHARQNAAAEATRAAHAQELRDLAGRVAAGEAERARIARDHEAERARLSAVYRAEIARRDAALDAQEQRIADVLESHSWRITAPLRVLGRAGARVQTTVTAGWSGLNHVARAGYRGVAAHSPRLAQELRAAVWPALRAANRRIFGAERRAAAPHLAYQVARRPQGQAPLVSVIVPNCNRAAHLRQRLDSIYAQTYRNFEVILMGDASSDDSRPILRDYAARHAERTRLLLDATESGGAFRQWEKGIAAARGALVWIAESDDWCSENLLEVLVPFFDNPAVQLAYVPTVFMDAEGQREVWSMDAYLADLGPERWHRPWIAPAPEIVRAGFAIRNIVPNAGSAVFRRSARLDSAVTGPWRDMRHCGDWVLYLNLIRGGLMAYAPDARHYFRQHRGNTSVAACPHDSYYSEHEQVACEVVRHYKVDPEIFEGQRAALMEHCRRNRGDVDPAAFARCFDTRRIAAAERARKPAVLMASYSFCAGGSEIFGIELANRIKAAGHTVTFLDCAREPEAPGMRAQLAPDIPVVSDLEGVDDIVRAFDIDIVHSQHAWVDNALLDRLPDDSPARTVVTLHGMYETIPAQDLDRIVPRMLARTGHFVHVSDRSTAPFVARGADLATQFRRIDSAIAIPARGTLARADLGLPDDAFVLTLASRAIPEKGWSEAIAAVGRARAASGRDIRLILLGDGPVHDRLARRGVPDHVLLRGFRPDTADHFAISDLGLLPSRFDAESFPLVVIECLQVGRPMIATALGEIPRMLDSGGARHAGALIALSGGAVPVETLGAEIARFATQPHLHAAACARVAAAARKFDPDAMCARYSAVYRDAMRGASQRPHALEVGA